MIDVDFFLSIDAMWTINRLKHEMILFYVILFVYEFGAEMYLLLCTHQPICWILNASLLPIIQCDQYRTVYTHTQTQRRSRREHYF